VCQTTTPMARLPFRKIFPFCAILFRAITVSGNSMTPTYNDGDWLIFRVIRKEGVSSAQGLVRKVVVIQRESYPGIHLIKRVVRADSTGLWVEGDNADGSTDSRQWGALPPQEIVGRVLLRYRRGKVSG